MANDIILLPGGGALTVPTTGSPSLATGGSRITSIGGEFDPDDMPIVRKLFQVLRDKQPRNMLRTCYYDAKERFKDFGISIPPSILSKAKPVVGWPNKAVRSLADKSVFEGFDIPAGQDDHGIPDIVDANALGVTVSEAIISAYKHSCAFLTIDRRADGGIRILPRAADWSAAIWDRPNHRIAAALTVTGDDDNGRITDFNVWLPGRVYRVWFGGRCFEAEIVGDYGGMDRVPVVPIVYDPQMDRPFGRSRISRTLMNLTDMAFRTMVRMEATAEFYSSPKLWLLGLQNGAIKKSKFDSLADAINSISRDVNGDVPTLTQVQQASMSPHSAMLETIAMLASSQTSIPPENLGIRLSNPTSAEALAAAENQLTRTADRQNRIFGHWLLEAMSIAVEIKDGTVPDLGGIRPVWAPTREVSDAARADFYTKVAGANAEYADSNVGLLRLGLDAAELESYRAYQAQQKAQRRIDQLRQQQLTQPTHAETAADDSQTSQSQNASVGADELKAKFDALGVAIRAGVEPQDAAKRLGLDGIRFTGMTPVSLRPQEGSDGTEQPEPAAGSAQTAGTAAGQGV